MSQEEAETATFLHEIGKGHLDVVKTLLAKNPTLAYRQGKLIDVTGKHIYEITETCNMRL